MISKFIKKINKQKWGYFFMIPALIFFIIFVLVPFIQAIKLGFFDYTIGRNNFIGFKNYVDIFKDDTFRKSLLNTLKYVVVVVPTVTIVAIIISVSVYEKSEILKTITRGAFYLPAIIPTVCLAVVWKWLYNTEFGVFNKLLNIFNMESINFLGDTRFAIYWVMLVIFTWSLGMPIILYIAALGGIPKTLHEAAEIDGANRLKKFIHVTLPLIKPTTLYVVIILTITVMQVVEVVILMTAGGPYYATSSLLFMIYNNAFKLAKFGYAAAIGNIMFLIIFILSIIQYKFLSSDVQY